jgi:hypothetical protein
MTRRNRFALPAMLVVMFAAPMAIADTTPSSAMAPDSTAKSAKKSLDPRLDDQAIVCKREETTGSRLGATKECHTRAEWAGRAASAREQMDRIQMTPQTH